jgi:site-specific recombinase XerD
MGSLSFKINRGKGIKKFNIEYPIYLRYTNGDVIYEASIGFKVLVKSSSKFYNKLKGNCDTISSVIGDHNLNALIRELTSYFMDQDRLWIEKGYKPSREEVKSYHLAWNSNDKNTRELELLDFFDQFIKDSEKYPNPNTGKLVAKSTLKAYKGTLEVLRLFNKKSTLTFSNINMNWYNRFVEWCYNKDLSTNTIGKHIKTLKTVLNIAVDKEVSNNIDFRHKNFKVLKEEVDSIYLNEVELRAMLDIDLSKSPRLENARDLFIIGAYTGLRVSDFNNLKKENILVERGVRMFKVFTTKTQKFIGVPIHKIVNEILNKYNGGLPPKMPEQKINESIKEVGFNAGIDRKIIVHSGSRKKENGGAIYKYQLIQSHTARRSFATNAFLAGISSLEIMRITGHTTESNFLKYIKATPEEVAIKMSEHSFFK